MACPSTAGGEDDQGLTYTAAGVDVAAAERLVGRFRDLTRQSGRPEVLAGVGPFASLFRLGPYRAPVLVASTDGVGTKVKLGTLLRRYDSLGMDLVNHCVNDILTTGAAPLFFLDYISAYDLPDEAKVELVQGMVTACRAVGCALVGGETADMPGVYAQGDFDIAGFIVGVVESDQIIDGQRIGEGDVLLGLLSNGLHTNGYSLARRVFGVGLGGDLAAEQEVLSRYHPRLGMTLDKALLLPHRCYYRELEPLLPYLKGIAHITGGGIPGNLPRILPDGLVARLDGGVWPVPPIFRLIQEQGRVSQEEMYRTFNMGLGMIVVCAEADVAKATAGLPEARVVGHVCKQVGQQRVEIAY